MPSINRRQLLQQASAAALLAPIGGAQTPSNWQIAGRDIEIQIAPISPHTFRLTIFPLENGQPGHPFGTWVYPLHNFNYHLQDLVTLRYFGGPVNQPVNSFWTFQGYTGISSICQDGS